MFVLQIYNAPCLDDLCEAALRNTKQFGPTARQLLGAKSENVAEGKKRPATSPNGPPGKANTTTARGVSEAPACVGNPRDGSTGRAAEERWSDKMKNPRRDGMSRRPGACTGGRRLLHATHDAELDATIGGSSFARLVVRYRDLFAKPFGLQSRFFDAMIDQELHHGFRSLLRQS